MKLGTDGKVAGTIFFFFMLEKIAIIHGFKRFKFIGRQHKLFDFGPTFYWFIWRRLRPMRRWRHTPFLWLWLVTNQIIFIITVDDVHSLSTAPAATTGRQYHVFFIILLGHRSHFLMRFPEFCSWSTGTYYIICMSNHTANIAYNYSCNYTWQPRDCYN